MHHRRELIFGEQRQFVGAVITFEYQHRVIEALLAQMNRHLHFNQREAISDITQGALMETSQISEIEMLLFTRSPHAGERLKQIADCGVAAIADMVLRAGRSMR